MAKKRKKKKPHQKKPKSQKPKSQKPKSRKKQPRLDAPNWDWQRIRGYHPAYCTCAGCENRKAGRRSQPHQEDTSRSTLAGDLLLLDALKEMDSRSDEGSGGDEARP